MIADGVDLSLRPCDSRNFGCSFDHHLTFCFGVNHINPNAQAPRCSLSAIASCNVSARTNAGNIMLSFLPDPGMGLEVIGRSQEGTVMIGINEDATGPPVAQARTELRERSKEYERKPVRVAVTAASSSGNVIVVK